MPDTAALILDAKSDILAWNPLAAALWEDFSEFAASQLRAVAECYPRYSDVRTLITELHSGSTEFERLRHSVDVVVPCHQKK